jgi:hypothetical protein
MLPGRCHPSASRPTAPLPRRTRVNRADFVSSPTGDVENRIETLNWERPHLLAFPSARGRSRFNLNETARLTRPNAIEWGCCHRARRHQGCPSAAAPPLTPPVRGDSWPLSMACG